MPAASTPRLSVQVSDFEDHCLLIQPYRLLCGSCSSGQRFAYSFLQIPPRDGHPCCSANDSPCRVHRGLSPPSECALPGAQRESRPAFVARSAFLVLHAASDRVVEVTSYCDPGSGDRYPL